MKKIYVVGILVGIVVLVILLLVLGGSKQQKGKIEKGGDTEQAVVQRVYEDDYLGWNYLVEEYNLKTLETNDGRVLTNVEVASKDETGPKFTVSLRVASQDLASYAEVEYRRSLPGDYSEEVAEWGDMRGLLFKTEDNKDKTIFFRRGDKILTVSMVSGDGSEVSDEVFRSFWQGIDWKPEKY